MKPNLSLATTRLLGYSDNQLRTAIVNCFAADPTILTLTLSGFRIDLDPEALGQERAEFVSLDSLRQIRDTTLFLLRHARPLEALPDVWHRRVTSYAAKHIAEHFIGGGVSNGCFILTVAMLGLGWERIPSTPNCYVMLDLPPRPQTGGYLRRDDDPPPKAGRGDDTRRLIA